MSRRFAISVSRCVFVDGKKPMKAKRSVAKPDTVNAARTADAPGAVVTGRSAAIIAAPSSYPGSAISGVPASDT